MTDELTRRKRGLPGQVMSEDGRQNCAVRYSIDGYQSRGRIRTADVTDMLPSWVHPDIYLTLHPHIGEALRIMITKRRDAGSGEQGQDHFAEFIVRFLTH